MRERAEVSHLACRDAISAAINGGVRGATASTRHQWAALPDVLVNHQS